jgi:hypothetical protein
MSTLQEKKPLRIVMQATPHNNQTTPGNHVTPGSQITTSSPDSARQASPVIDAIKREAAWSATTFNLDLVPAPVEYVQLFWRAYLGAVAFDLWSVLCSLLWYPDEHDGRWPTISQIAAVLGGVADRYRILGRKASGDHIEHDGALHRLVSEGLVTYQTIGQGNGTRYRFQIHTQLPSLTPEQVAQLPESVQRLHREWEGRWEQVPLPASHRTAQANSRASRAVAGICAEAAPEMGAAADSESLGLVFGGGGLMTMRRVCGIAATFLTKVADGR